MFFVLPALLKHGIGFWLSLAIACLITIVLYATTFWLLSRLGIEH